MRKLIRRVLVLAPTTLAAAAPAYADTGSRACAFLFLGFAVVLVAIFVVGWVRQAAPPEALDRRQKVAGAEEPKCPLGYGRDKCLGRRYADG